MDFQAVLVAPQQAWTMLRGCQSASNRDAVNDQIFPPLPLQVHLRQGNKRYFSKLNIPETRVENT